MTRLRLLPFEPGDVVSVRFGVVLSHYGVVTSRGTIISNSRLHDGVVEQSPDQFSTGREIRLHRRYSSLDGHLVESRARRQLGRDYDLFGSISSAMRTAASQRRCRLGQRLSAHWATCYPASEILTDSDKERRRPFGVATA